MDKLDIERIVFIGRTFKEYMDIFGLDEELLANGPVLDCAAGPSSFTAEARQKGLEVSACDVMYAEQPFELFKRGEADIRYVFSRLDETSEKFRWDYYKDKAQIVDFRRKALGSFIKDFGRRKNTGVYKEAELPKLPYDDNSFELVLSGHFLFLYSEMLDPDLHLRCIEELIRVSAREVRVFPLVGLDARPYKHLDDILASLREKGIETEIVDVPLEFLAGGNKMLRLRKR